MMTRTQPIVLVGGRQDGEVIRLRGDALPPKICIPVGDATLVYVVTDTRDLYGSTRYVLAAD